MVIPLNYLEQNQQARIVWMALPDEQAACLALWGFEAGTLISCIQKGSHGNMSAYGIRHKVVALRTRDANGILVKLI